MNLCVQPIEVRKGDSVRLFLLASLLVLPCACSAATLRPVPADKAQPAELAALELPAVPAADTDAVELDLPEAPELVESYVAPAAQTHSAHNERFTLEKQEFSSTSVNPLYSLPVVGNVAVRMGAENFNTDDGSSLDAFAICYRLNARASVQVLPGDPAPVKIPVTTMANNMGVTVGMVYRLSRRP
jgi:hypothetical protein